MTGWADTLQGFVGVLRRNGLAVATEQTIEALRAAELVGPDDPTTLKYALRAVLVKESDRLEAFDGLFQLYFEQGDVEPLRQVGDPEPRADAGSGEQAEPPAPAVDPSLLAGMSPQAAAAAAGNGAPLDIALQAAAGAGSVVGDARYAWQEGAVTWRARRVVGADAVEAELDAAIAAARRRGDDDQAEVLAARRRQYAEAIARWARRQLRQADFDLTARFRRDQLRQRSFFRASKAEMAAIRREVERLGRRLRTRTSVRRRRSRRGALDVQATLRANLQSGLVPFDLRHERKTKRRPALTLWVDLSDSVRQTSEFMLMLVHVLQDRFRRVRSFGFAADCAELTDVFRYRRFEEAFTDIMSGKVFNLWMRSDYGEALRQFERGWPDAVDDRTTLVVIGDARSNYQPHEGERMRAMARRARHSVWFNPEHRGSWGLGDSVMLDVVSAFDAAHTVSNIAQLERAIDLLLDEL